MLGLLDGLAVEAALLLKDEYEGEVTVVSLCNDTVVHVLKKPLAMGADELILIYDQVFEESDAFSTAQALVDATTEVVDYDLIVCGTARAPVD